MEETFFTYTVDGDTLTIDTGIPDNAWEVSGDQLNDLFLLKDVVCGKDVEIKGRGFVELDFAIGFYFTKWGGRTISIETRGGKGLVAHHVKITDTKQSVVEKDWLILKHEQQYDKLTILPKKQGGNYADDELQFDIPIQVPQSSEIALGVTGNGGLHMYAFLGVCLAARSNVFLSKPINPYDLFFYDDGIIPVLSQENLNGKIIGILGDPNSGKSVFSQIFANAIIKECGNKKMIWRLDCDFASRTPLWYLASSASSDELERNLAVSDRKSMKVKWTHELEQKVAAQLAYLKKHLHIGIADMPGGKHNEEKNEHDRIPDRYRAEMMTQCDSFIVICRKDKRDDILIGWRKALAQYGLADRIIAVFTSDTPEKDFTIENVRKENGITYADITGLDRRKNLNDIAPIIQEKLKDFIVNDIINSNKQKGV